MTACGGGDTAETSRPPAELSLVPPDGAKDVKPNGPLTARVNHGTLTAPTVTGPDGKETASETTFRTLKPSKEQTETASVLPVDGTSSR